MIISITGAPGTGKTSVGKLLAKRLGYNFYSVGDLRGKMAMERGMTIDELNKLGEKDASTDTMADDYQRELGTKEDNFIIEGRLSWHFIPHSFKVLLTCATSEAARRVFEARKHESEGRQDEREYHSVADAEKTLTERVASDVVRYQTHYGIDYRDTAHYDLVIDTTDIQGVEAVTDQVEQALRAKAGTPLTK
jgi:cytidylate kinase